jgi:uncharacterized protein YjbI with pentapeptide repeats
MGEGIMDTEKLNEILRLHQMWFNDEPEGKRAYFYRADLRGADLRGEDLTRANLSGANLCGADLSYAILSGANLVDAKLRRAILSCACLYEANLAGADLRNARLSYADLQWAYLYGADLREANLSGADLRGIDLHEAKLPKNMRYYTDLPEHWVTIIDDVASIGCYQMPLSEWLERGVVIGRDHYYTDDEIDLYMEILRREHERERTK